MLSRQFQMKHILTTNVGIVSLVSSAEVKE